jgi:hypothetical protein
MKTTMMIMTPAIAVFISITASARQVDSIPHCDATMAVYAAEIDAQSLSRMTPAPNHAGSVERSQPPAEFSTVTMAADFNSCLLLRVSEIARLQQNCKTDSCSSAAWQNAPGKFDLWQHVGTFANYRLAKRVREYIYTKPSLAVELDKGLNVTD